MSESALSPETAQPPSEVWEDSMVSTSAARLAVAPLATG